jgi:hypothetical protein
VEIEPRSSKLDKSSSHRLVRHRPGRHTQLRTWEHPEGAVVFQHACMMGLEANWGRATGLDDRQTGSNSKNRARRCGEAEEAWRAVRCLSQTTRYGKTG